MRRSSIVFVLALMGIQFSAPLHAELEIFACEPEWAELAKELGGDQVSTTSATQGLQDPHYIQARPSLISRMRKADLVICTGAQLEIGWLPMLLGKANNPAVLPGKDGLLEASNFVTKLEIPDRVDRAQGDIHVQGNPHIQLSPHNIRKVAQPLSDRLAKLEPEHAAYFAERLSDFLSRWDVAIDRWEKMAAPLRGKRLVAHHKSFVYLDEWLDLKELATLEPLPGIPPTSAHLAELLDMLGKDGSGADFIIREAYQSAKASEWLSERTGIPAVMLPTTVGGSPGARDLFSLFDDILQRLLSAVR